MSRNPYLMPSSRQRQHHSAVPSSVGGQSRQEEKSSAQRPPPQRAPGSHLGCNKCGIPLNSTVFLYKCDCLICEECFIKEKCPACTRPVTGPGQVREFLITSLPDDEPPAKKECDAKGPLYQWMFVKARAGNRPLNTFDVYRRLLMQHQKQREATLFVLKQFSRRTGILTRDLMKYKDGVNATKSQETALKQEIHKYKSLFDAQNVKLESVSQQLKEKEEQVAKYRKMYKESPNSFSSPLQLQMPRHSMNAAAVRANSMPPPSVSCIDPRGPIMDPTLPSSQARGGFAPLDHHQNHSAAQPQQPYVDGRHRPHTPILSPQQYQDYDHHQYHGQTAGITERQPQGNPYDGIGGMYSSRARGSVHSSRPYSGQMPGSQSQRHSQYEKNASYASGSYHQRRSSHSGQQSHSHSTNPYEQPLGYTGSNRQSLSSRDSQLSQSHSTDPYEQPIGSSGGSQQGFARKKSPHHGQYSRGSPYGGSGGSVAGSVGSRGSNSASGRILRGISKNSPFSFSGGAKRPWESRGSVL